MNAKGREPKTHQWYVEKLYSYYGDKIKVRGIYTRSIDVIEHTCYIHGSFFTSPHNLVCKRKYKPDEKLIGCSKCSQEYATSHIRKTHEQIVSKLKKVHGRTIKLLDSYTTVTKHHRFKCNKNHVWKAKPHHILNGTGCPYCFVCSPRSKISENGYPNVKKHSI